MEADRYIPAFVIVLDGKYEQRYLYVVYKTVYRIAFLFIVFIKMVIEGVTSVGKFSLDYLFKVFDKRGFYNFPVQITEIRDFCECLQIGI